MDTAANRSLCRNPAGLWEAFHTRTILEARALLCTQQHDLVVDFGFCRGIIPRCEGALGIADGSVRDIALLSRASRSASSSRASGSRATAASVRSFPAGQRSSCVWSSTSAR